MNSLEITLDGLAKGKKQHDKRDDIKEREWKVAKERIMKNAHRG